MSLPNTDLDQIAS